MAIGGCAKTRKCENGTFLARAGGPPSADILEAFILQFRVHIWDPKSRKAKG
jgi:hypothetical protein